MLRTFGNYRIF